MSKQPPNRKTLDSLANSIKEGALLPLASEGKENVRHFGIRIARDGTWYYLGTPIERLQLVKLFSTALKLDENGDYWLVTPVELGRIDVDDVPFVAGDISIEGEGRDIKLTLRTNLDHEVVAGKNHPIRVTIDPDTKEPSPYILIRDNLEALISRAIFFDLVERAEEVEVRGGVELQVWSDGEKFSFGVVDMGD